MNWACENQNRLLWAMCLLVVAWGGAAFAAEPGADELEAAFRNPPAEALPWTLWHWCKGRVSAEGITADLQAMKHAGLGGAYLMSIDGPEDPPVYDPPTVQLSPRFWRMVRHAAAEADRLGLKLGMHVCDGFATAGGPWITPELSMQQLTFARTQVKGSDQDITVARGPIVEGHYQDIAVLAFPSPPGAGVSSEASAPQVVTSDNDPDAGRLALATNGQRYRSADPCWIEYRFEQPFTCRSVTITPDGRNYQCQRMTLLASDDGQEFRRIVELRSPRHGWQEEGRPVTHAVPTATARVFRFAWTPDGSEPGSEDLDNAKWSPVLKVNSIVLGAEPVLHDWQGKSGSVWRVSEWTADDTAPAALCVPRDRILDLTDKLDAQGQLDWQPPPGEWTVLRIGHTSTGRQNATGGGGRGLECDKLNPDAVRLQYDRWFGEAEWQIAAELGEQREAKVLTRLFLDSWECGSQNWTPGFRDYFHHTRGYDLTHWLPTLAGIPVGSAEESERFLRDFRATIAERMTDAFFGTISQLAKQSGVEIAGECTAPTMLGDGMRHFDYLDTTMGEFWLNSPTHDKPNDMRDAISAAHIYGKRVIQAEAFTQLRIGWDETPGSLKRLGDRNLALGANRLVPHVFAHNPWLDRRPGQTLGGVGLYFQRDQPWMRGARGWMQHLARCHAVLQAGRPVVDVAVWTGDDLPRRSVAPERLVNDLPGLIGPAAVERERSRLKNQGQPTRELPRGVRSSANSVNPHDWLDPLNGYAYDSINTDALLRLGEVNDGRLTLPGGAGYRVLVLPSAQTLSRRRVRMTPALAEKLAEFVSDGLQVVCSESIASSPGLDPGRHADQQVDRALTRLRSNRQCWLEGPWRKPTLEPLSIAPDLIIEDARDGEASVIAWNHRAGQGWDAYFVSNQSAASQDVSLSLRAKRAHLQQWDPVTGEIRTLQARAGDRQRTRVQLKLAASQSLLVVLSDNVPSTPMAMATRREEKAVTGPWRVQFEPLVGAQPPALTTMELGDLSQSPDPLVAALAGSATYDVDLDWRPAPEGARVWLEVGTAAALAEVSVNGEDCGVLWTLPWRVEVTGQLKSGQNHLSIKTHSTWKNRLLADSKKSEVERVTWTSAPVQLQDQEISPFGLLGPVTLVTETR